MHTPRNDHVCQLNIASFLDYRIARHGKFGSVPILFTVRCLVGKHACVYMVCRRVYLRARVCVHRLYVRVCTERVKEVGASRRLPETR